ncbi:MAG TPA: efflux RND transporter periplasmic adaptor subunit [Gemmatimonadaceae bacterium]|nr:efflux RND transporter periplasmic adaptor subunit [Gemmatimonadaceae bacterium]
MHERSRGMVVATFAVGMGVSLAVGACADRTTKAAAGGQVGSPTERRRDPVSVHVIHLVSERRARAVTLPGELRGFQEVRIYPKVTAFVRALYVDRGSVVRKGQVLARLDAPELVAQRTGGTAGVASADAQLQAARAKYEGDVDTYRRLQEAARTSGVVAPNELERARSAAAADSGGLVSAERQADAARSTLKSVSDVAAYLTITAPFAGVITQRGADSGALVGPGTGGATQAMFALAEAHTLRLVVALPESNAGALLGSGAGPEVATFQLRAIPGKVFTAVLSRRAHSLDEQTRTEALEFDVPNADGQLKPGMYADVTLHVSPTEPGYYVPVSAVSASTQGVFLIRVQRDVAEWVPVQRADATKDTVRVVGDLHDGDAVVIPATEELARGSRVWVAGDSMSTRRGGETRVGPT